MRGTGPATCHRQGENAQGCGGAVSAERNMVQSALCVEWGENNR